ncbi:unnamed protein product [Toxocara canis]|uniref:HIG1 domain-containing protein n=1 Tax=Toxocara canis TaxID=6265 RepID=A0A183VB28_TOXCA|nr:unnamed protein product [Toxocara canis]
MLARAYLLVSPERMVLRRSLMLTAKASSTPNTFADIPHATKASFIQDLDKNRAKFNVDAESGLKPTPMQRHFLVLTRLYRNRNEIPEYVASGTMMRMHNRMRVVFIFVAVAFFYTIFLCFEKAMALKVHKDKYPAIPADIGYASGKNTTGTMKTGVWQNAIGNPPVIIGLGLTGAALMGMMRKAFLGDKFGAQRFMRYRIMAQFFTVTALVAGVTLFGVTYESREDKRRQLPHHQ